jgi:cysteinyl-tRNA synthetase
MSLQHLGSEFDIHGGGQDLIFPHHENEIAQSEGAGHPFARYWMHNGFVTVNQEKMSKSLGNFFTLKDILAQYEPMVVRYFLLSQHYRSPLNFSDQDLKAAQAVWKQRVLGAHQMALGWRDAALADSSVTDPFWTRFQAALVDDLNSAEAFGILNQVCSQIYASEKASNVSPWMRQSSSLLQHMFDWLGLVPPVEESWEPAILSLRDEREQARKSKNWKRSDEIRDELKQRGILIEDSSSGPRLKRIG